MTDIVSFGIPEVDRLLGGGLIVGSTNYLEVDRGTQELAFVAAYLNEGFRANNLCGMTLYDFPPEVLIERLTDLGVNVKKALDSGSLIIADFWEEGEYDPERRGPILKTSNPNDPGGALRLYLDMAEEARRRVNHLGLTGLRLVAYSASTAVMNFKLEATYKIAKAARVQVRLGRVTNLSLFNPKMFDGAVVAALEDTCDSIITLSVKEVHGKYQRFIRVKQSPLPNFQMDEVPYDIIDGKPLLKL